MNDLKLHPEAEQEYDGAIRWYTTESAVAAARFINEVARVAALIREQPKLFPKYDRRHRYVVLNRFPYYLVYLARPRLTYVIAVAHASRPPNYWRDRELIVN